MYIYTFWRGYSHVIGQYEDKKTPDRNWTLHSNLTQKKINRGFTGLHRSSACGTQPKCPRTLSPRLYVSLAPTGQSAFRYTIHIHLLLSLEWFCAYQKNKTKGWFINVVEKLIYLETCVICKDFFSLIT